jgi:hypothetical protein
MKSVQRHLFWLPMAAALSLLTVSCGESRVSQCSKIITIVNQAGNNTKLATNDGKKKDHSAILKAVEAREKAAKELEAVKLTDKKLQEFQAAFVKWYKDTGKTSRDLVNALKKDDQPNIEKLLKNLRSSLKQENELVSGINSYCQQSK